MPTTTLAVPDLHAPFMHPDAVDFLDAILQKYQPGRVVLLGDVADQHALSRFTRDPGGMSAGDEFEAADSQLRPLYDLIPRAFVCWGNHDRRIYDRAAEAGIPADAIRPMPGILGCPGRWQWADEWEFDGTVYVHGDNWSGPQAHIKAARAHMQNTVIGHIHAHAGIHYDGNRKHLFWGFNAGCLIDRKRYAFAYAKRNPARPIAGVGLVDGMVPRFVPMHLKAGGRWTRRLS